MEFEWLVPKRDWSSKRVKEFRTSLIVLIFGRHRFPVSLDRFACAPSTVFHVPRPFSRVLRPVSHTSSLFSRVPCPVYGVPFPPLRFPFPGSLDPFPVYRLPFYRVLFPGTRCRVL